jgi:steroid 5-alpha reductase family enzyme
VGVGELFAGTGALIAGCMAVMWLLSLALRDASIVDIFWGLGFATIAAATFLWTRDGGDSRRGLIAAMTIVWGLRLGLYLFWRNAGHGEDPRYVAMRRNLGSRFWWVSLFSVFGLQGVLMWIVSLPVQLGQVAPGDAFTVLDGAGVALYAVGLAFETVGDAQLARFRSDPANAGAVMDRGLWRYTRHPNYFGDFCVWWGIFLVALSSAGAAGSVVGPLVMSFLLLRVSGVPMLERSIRKRRPDYERYARQTSAFFPRPPRSDPTRRAG